MATGDRSLTEVFQNIIGNVQDIVRSEVRLAKTELREEAVRAKSSAILLSAGAAAALFAIFFLLLTIVYALALVMPGWGAALIVGATLAIVASLTFNVGVKRFKLLYATPKNTVEITKEKVEWTKQHTK